MSRFNWRVRSLRERERVRRGVRERERDYMLRAEEGEDSCCVSIPSATPSILYTAENLPRVLSAAFAGSAERATPTASRLTLLPGRGAERTLTLAHTRTHTHSLEPVLHQETLEESGGGQRGTQRLGIF